MHTLAEEVIDEKKYAHFFWCIFLQQLALLLDVSPWMSDSIEILGQSVRLELPNEQPEAGCPLCGHLAHRVQSRERRTLTDVALGGTQLHLRVWVRRFFCDTPSWERRIFAQRLHDLASPYARRTQRLTQALAELGFVLAGKAGAQLAADFGMSGSRETI